jgi:hypothetical protein
VAVFLAEPAGKCGIVPLPIAGCRLRAS